MKRPVLIGAGLLEALRKAAQQFALFNESEHPRAPDGQFAPKGGSTGAGKPAAAQATAGPQAQPRRKRGSFRDLDKTMEAALHNAAIDGVPKYIFASYRGYLLENKPPGGLQRHYKISPDGTVELWEWESSNKPGGKGEWKITVGGGVRKSPRPFLAPIGTWRP